MNGFFCVIYIVPNRFSEERIAVGLLANLEGIPHFYCAEKKLAFAVQRFSNELKTVIRKGFRFLDFDVNKIRRGEEALSLFDAPYSKKLLKELTHQKRGVIQYSDLYELAEGKTMSFEKLCKKFLGELPVSKEVRKKGANFKLKFREYTAGKRFSDFERNYTLRANQFPFIYRDMKVDLCRKKGFYTIFYSIDFSKSIQTIQSTLSRFRLIVQSLQEVSSQEGLSKGRYYLVYESTSAREKIALIETIKKEKNLGYEIIRMTEVKDKI